MKIVGNNWDNILKDEYNKKYFGKVDHTKVIDCKIETMYMSYTDMISGRLCDTIKNNFHKNHI